MKVIKWSYNIVFFVLYIFFSIIKSFQQKKLNKSYWFIYFFFILCFIKNKSIFLNLFSFKVMQLVGSLYLLYLPYCVLILWEFLCNGKHLHVHPKILSLASLLLASSTPINGLLYGLKSRTLRRSVQNYWRKKITKSELQQVKKTCTGKINLLLLIQVNNLGNSSKNTKCSWIKKTISQWSSIIISISSTSKKIKWSIIKFRNKITKFWFR